jgi:hypothetical protein
MLYKESKLFFLDLNQYRFIISRKSGLHEHTGMSYISSIVLGHITSGAGLPAGQILDPAERDVVEVRPLK